MQPNISPAGSPSTTANIPITDMKMSIPSQMKKYSDVRSLMVPYREF